MAEKALILVRGIADQIVDLPLSQGPATGYGWLLDLPPGVMKIEDGPANQPSPGRLLGGSAGAALRVVAPKGRYRINARLVRPWEPDKPIKTMLIDLVIESHTTA